MLDLFLNLKGGRFGIGRKLADLFDQDELSSLQPRNVKRGLFVVISWRPPRIVVRKMSSKVMRTEKARYVQSVA